MIYYRVFTINIAKNYRIEHIFTLLLLTDQEMLCEISDTKREPNKTVKS